VDQILLNSSQVDLWGCYLQDLGLEYEYLLTRALAPKGLVLEYLLTLVLAPEGLDHQGVVEALDHLART